MRSAMMLRSTQASGVDVQPLAERLAGDRHGVEMQQVLQFAHQRAHAAGGEEIFHIAVADRLQVHQHRRGVGQFVEPLQRTGMPARPAMAVRWMMALVEPPMASSTRSAFSIDFRRDDLVGRQLGADQLDGQRAGRFRRAQAVGMHGGDGGGAGQGHAQRFGDAGHGRGGAHHRAGAGGGGELAFDLVDFLVVDRAGAILRPEAAAIGAGAQPFAAMAAGHHRPADQHHRRLVGRHRAHQLRRHGLVAAAHQHDRVHRLRAHHFLGVHRHQVAEFQAGRVEERLRRARWSGIPSAARRRRARRASPPPAVRENGGGNC